MEADVAKKYIKNDGETDAKEHRESRTDKQFVFVSVFVFCLLTCVH